MNKKKLLIWSYNKWKIKDYKNFLWDLYELYSPYDLNLNVKVEENDYSLIENSIKKAEIFCKASNLPTISEDTWFFIKELNWKPWISIKTWWWELKETLEVKKYLEFLKQKISNLKDTSCYFLTVLTLSLPSWESYSILYKEEWYIDRKKFDNIFEEGYPLSSVFIANWRRKTWSEMTKKEQKDWWKKFENKIKLLLSKYYD